MPLQVRRGTNAERLAMTQPLAAGELLYVVSPEERLYIGNGTTLGGVQITGYNDGDAKDAAAEIFTDGSHNGITFSYNTATNVMTANVNLSDYAGTIKADAFKGSLFADDGSTVGGQPLVDAISGTFNGNLIGNVTGNITGNIIGNVTGNVTGNIIGNVTGDLTGNTVGFHTGDIKGSIFADDSGLMVDGTSGIIVAPVDAQSITGNIFGRYVEISGISTTDPSLKAGLKIVTDGNADDIYDLFTLSGAKTAVNGMSIIYERSRGTPTSTAPLLDGDEILGMYWFGADSTSAQQVSSAIIAMVDGPPTAGVVPGVLEFATTNISTGVITPGLTIDSSQVIGVASNTLVAGGASGEVNTGSVATYLKIKIGNTEYAIPAYGINP
jgi:hypothetical protein